MKKEAKFYTIIKNSCDISGAFYHKIGDIYPSGEHRFMLSKPFDLFFIYSGVAVFTEVKYIPEPKAFSVQKNLSDHQNGNLSLIVKNQDFDKYAIRPIITLGVYTPRTWKRLYFFDYIWLKKNPLKKNDLLKIKKFIDVKSQVINGKRKDCFHLSEFFENIIGRK